MSFLIDSNSHLLHDQARSFALNCPHCQVFSHLTAVSVPQYPELIASRPAQVGIVYRCDACNAPLFLKFNVKVYGPSRIELSSNFTELERAREKFAFMHLPEHVERALREALTAYSHGLFDAFGSMCRRTMQAVFHDLGESGRMQIYGELNEARAMSELDTETFVLVKKVVFGSDADGWPSLPELDDYSAGVVLEIVKDLLYQAYVRRGKLQQAMTVRRYFADDDEDGKVTQIGAVDKR